MPRERRESGGKLVDAGEGKGASQETKWAAEDLGNSLPGLPTSYHNARRCFPGVHSVDEAHHGPWRAVSRVLRWNTQTK